MPLTRKPRWWRRRPWRKDQDPLPLPQVEQSPQVASAPPPQVGQSPPVASAPQPQVGQSPPVASRPNNAGRNRRGRNNAGPNKAVLNEAGPYRFGTQKVSRDVALALKTIGYEEPTRIQSDCIGPLLAGNDVVGQAHTGTGKTAAFGIPLVEQADPSQVFIQGLILVPTRELAMQVRDEQIGRAHV